ncbi:MAG TPA: aminotransferase class IV [Phenylobacterium sp.]|jgi:branched-chain amino acid aminotransferase|uniref:aminotransferase class IV n=1 Tax=Phenylobacterium sp. TaxID=1871053 RepID=UPI002C3DF5B5|nr:aminotransferase class IV [Phenylobacterium sp.]HXA38417.1 aminotransferase class IV [Phenylobacterium sp.]
MPGSQDFAADPRNADLLIYVNGALVPRAEAKVSIFDAGFVLGDGVWEGLRLHKGRLLFLETHLDRLYWGLEKIGLDIGLGREALIAEIRKALDANRMTHGAHLRLMVTRGEKAAANQDPRNWLGKPTVVITAEYKEPAAQIATRGLSLATSQVVCSPAEMFDMRLNSHSRLNLITALLEAIKAGADEAVMLDPGGHVSSCNATNLFWVRDGRVRTSSGQFCFNGVTRANVIALCKANGIPLDQGHFPLADLHGADEAFVTGTFGGLTPVREVDGHGLTAALPGPVTARLRGLYEALKDADAGA